MFKPKETIHSLAEKGQTQKIRDFLKKDESLIRARDKFENTPLHYAAQQGNMELSRILISKKADVNAQNMKGMTALHLAVAQVQRDLCSILINAGAKVDIKDRDGKTPLDWAIELNHRGLAEYLRRTLDQQKPS